MNPTKSIPVYQIDAFTDRPFTGNPAAICPLDEWLPDDLMQAIAAENNLAETAFFVAEGRSWRLRWFTPTVEVDLCGHATLAAAWVLFNEMGITETSVEFLSRSGSLLVTRDGEQLTLDFPSLPPKPTSPPDGLLACFSVNPSEVLVAENGNYLLRVEDESSVKNCQVDFPALKKLSRLGVIVTAPGNNVDFVSRFFAPAAGIDEDPVTGSAHCTSAPYWAKALGKSRLTAKQTSQRSGELTCELRSNRVLLTGRGCKTLQGNIYIPE